jgi:biotin synthase
MLRDDWTKEEIAQIYHRSFLDLIYEAATTHRNNNDYAQILNEKP